MVLSERHIVMNCLHVSVCQSISPSISQLLTTIGMPSDNFKAAGSLRILGTHRKGHERGLLDGIIILAPGHGGRFGSPGTKALFVEHGDGILDGPVGIRTRRQVLGRLAGEGQKVFGFGHVDVVSRGSTCSCSR